MEEHKENTRGTCRITHDARFSLTLDLIIYKFDNVYIVTLFKKFKRHDIMYTIILDVIPMSLLYPLIMMWLLKYHWTCDLSLLNYDQIMILNVTSLLE
jgi:hypothetical protein